MLLFRVSFLEKENARFPLIIVNTAEQSRDRESKKLYLPEETLK